MKIPNSTEVGLAAKVRRAQLPPAERSFNEEFRPTSDLLLALCKWQKA
jgi:hypothetical protein